MTKELRELLQRVEQLRTEARSLLAEGKLDEAEKRKDEMLEAQRKIAVQRALEADEVSGDGLSVEDNGRANTREAAELEAEYRDVFLKGLRRNRITSDERTIINEYRALHAGGAAGDPDGNASLIVPQDVQTQINEAMRTLNDLSAIIAHEDVTTLTGSRVLEKDADMTPFATVTELGTISETDNPQFVGVSYALVKRAGILPISNDLLRASDQNVLRYVSRWIAKKHVVTKNNLIVALFNAMNKTAIADIKALNKVLNVTLDPAVSASAILLVNQDGYDWLDNQVDGNGRFLLQDDVTQPGRKVYKGRPIVPVANRYLPTASGKAPLIVGNLKEFAVHFSLGRYELASTREGGDAFKRDSTDLRCITYDDAKTWDAGAAVFGQLNIA